MFPFEEQLTRLLEQHSGAAYVGLFGLAALAVLWAVVSYTGGSSLGPDQRRRVKEEVVRLMRGEYRGLKCEGIVSRLGVERRELEPLLEELIADRFLLTEGDACDPVYRLRGLDNY